MKRFCTLLALFLVMLTASEVVRAQNPPVLLSFQGVLLTQSGALFPTQQSVITIKLFYSEAGNDLAWEDNVSTLIEKGVFNIILGEQVPLDSVDFEQQLWVEISLPGAQPYQKRTKLTAAPYAAIARLSGMAGGLTPDATGAVRSLNNTSGDVKLIASGGLAISVDQTTGSVFIDASGVVGNLTIIGDSVVYTRDTNGIVRVGVNSNSIDQRHLRGTGVSAGTWGDSINIPQFTVGTDGRITGVRVIRVSRRPSNMLPDRVLTSGPTGELVESDPLGNQQVLMGRAGTGPRVTTIAGNRGVVVSQQNDSLKIGLDTTFVNILPVASGRWTNTTTERVFRHDVDISTATPIAFQALAPGARIIVSVESSTAATNATVFQRSGKGFTIDFAGGLPPGSTVNWIVINL
jgi:hypothetical protein